MINQKRWHERLHLIDRTRELGAQREVAEAVQLAMQRYLDERTNDLIRESVTGKKVYRIWVTKAGRWLRLTY